MRYYGDEAHRWYDWLVERSGGPARFKSRMLPGIAVALVLVARIRPMPPPERDEDAGHPLGFGHAPDVEVHHDRDVRRRDPGRGTVHDREGPHHAGIRHPPAPELRGAGAGVGIAAVEVQRTGLHRLVRYQVWGAVIEDEVVNNRDRLSHGPETTRTRAYPPLKGNPARSDT